MVSRVSSSNFVKQTSFAVEYAPATVSKWRSTRTGLQITYINQPSPIVNGYFAVATEIKNDSGCPHTLEHLVFMGSKKYPYKGLLDSLGNRLYSSTNAWTSVDQTVYTLTTAGWEGFKKLLPIYLDHLFNPTLTDEACLTEVYHIDGQGKEKGVVFSEMQGIENQSWFISYLNMQRSLYKESSGYSSETGGLMKELRHLTNDQIKDFHKNSYRPDNLCVVITGSIDEEELIAIMTEFDDELTALPTISNKRPFVDSDNDGPLSETIVKRVEFPDKDESMGELLISWIGPKANENLISMAVDIVGSYFTDSPISIFNKHLVEVENPYATDIDYTTDDYVRTTLNFTVNGVPTEKLEELDSKLKELLTEHSNPDVLDLTYMRQVLNQQKLKFVSSTEKSASLFSNIAITEFIYGNPDGSDLDKWIKDLKEYDILSQWTTEQWCDVIKKYFVDNKSATILGYPSAALNKRFKQQKKELLKSIKEKYGPEGLKKLQEKLDSAQEKNDLPIPDSILTQFEKPDPSLIEFIKTNSYKAGYTEKLIEDTTNNYIEDDDLSQLIKLDTPQDFPLFVHFEEFKSQFTTINLVLSSTRIEPRLLAYMSIIEEIFSLSLQLPDKYVSFEEVVSQINNDLIEFNLDNGYDNQFYDLISVRVKFEVTKYTEAINWLLNALKYSVFEESRVKIIVEKIINLLTDKKRNGELMMYSSQYRNLFNSKSLRKAQDSIETELFYRHLLETINNGEFSKIQKDLNDLRNDLFKLDNIKVIVLGNVKDLPKPVSSWSSFVQTFVESEKSKDGDFKFLPDSFKELPRAFQFKSELGEKCSNHAFLVITPAADSTHLISSTPIPTNYDNPDIYKIALATEFLIAVEGPFWRGIRGTGLAYGASIRRNVETGLLTFSIYRGSDAKQAWTVAKEIVEEYASEKLDIDEISIENSISAIVNGLANAEDNSSDAANGKISDNLFKRRGPNYTKSFLKELRKLSKADIVYALKKYFVPLFTSDKSVVFASIPPEFSSEFGAFFSEQGYTVNQEEIRIENSESHEHQNGHQHQDGCCSFDDEASTDESDSDENDDSDESDHEQ
jgi:Zn-dependent M16 (insulinase) family peptidase